MKIHIKKKIQQFDYNEELHFVFFATPSYFVQRESLRDKRKKHENFIMIMNMMMIIMILRGYGEHYKHNETQLDDVNSI